MKNPKRHLWVSAFEQSADQYLSGVLKEIHKTDSSLEISGIGGIESRRAGLQPLFPAEELSVMGLVEVLRSLPKVFLKLREIKRHLKSNPPDVALLIDYPGLHFALLPTFKKLGTRVIYFIPPKVWVWRKNRIHTLKKFVDQVLCIFPFEKEFFEREGLSVKYVGNPLLDQLPLGLSKSEARSKLGFKSDIKVLAVLLGSRKQEIEFHLEVMSKAALQFQKETTAAVHFSFPNQFSNEQRKNWEERILKVIPGVKIGWGDSHALMRGADYGLIKSGTATLEAALLGLRHVVVYRLNPLTCFLLRHVVGFRQFAGLSNIILDYQAQHAPHFEERLCAGVTEENLFESLIRLHESDALKVSQERALEEIKERMKINGSPTELVAQSIQSELKVGRARVKPFSWIKFVSAHLWHRVHQLRFFFSRPKKLPCKVISVGNYQMGGTGKTPFVLELLAEAKRRKKKVWVLTRGYRSLSESQGSLITSETSSIDARTHGDETVMIHKKFPEVPIGVGKDRYASFLKLSAQLGETPDWVILDDGAQNLQIKKDVEILLVTADRPGQTWFREIPSPLLKANEIRILTKGHDRKSHDIQVKLATVFKQDPPHQPLYLVSGISEPEQLKESLENLGLKIGHHHVFRDHAHWSDEMVAEFIARAEQQGFALAMTEKDLARVSTHHKNIWVVDSEIHWLNGRSHFERTLD